MEPALRTGSDWFLLGRSVLDEVLKAFARYGVKPDAALNVIATEEPLPSYEPATRTIRLGAPDPAEPLGRLYWHFVRSITGAKDLLETQTIFEAQLPLVVAHELAHHLRHHYGANIENNFIEEQVAQSLALAFLGEHEAYRRTLPSLERWAEATARTVGRLEPQTTGYLGGFRLSASEVLVALGNLDMSALKEASAVATTLGTTPEEVLVASGAVSQADLERARAEQRRTEQYFNRRYMTSLNEYASFGCEWLGAFLERAEIPSLGEALHRFILTSDWEHSRRDATRLLLEGALRSPDPSRATAAVRALVLLDGAGAVPALSAALDAAPPAVASVLLRTLADLPGGPSAALAAARSAFSTGGVSTGAAARLLRLAGEPVGSQRVEPGEVAEAALYLASRDVDRAWGLIEGLLAGDETAALAGLGAVADMGGGLLGHVKELARHGDERIRSAAARALGSQPEGAAALVGLLGDPAPLVRRAAEDGLRGLGTRALSALEDAHGVSEAACVAALRMAEDLGSGGARPRLEALADDLLQRAEELADLETQLSGDPTLELLRRTTSQERRRLARLALRARTRPGRQGLLDMAERALDTPDPRHESVGLKLARQTVGGGALLAALLAPGVPAARPNETRDVLVRALGAEMPMLRALAVAAAARALPEDGLGAFLRPMADDPSPLVRAELRKALRDPKTDTGDPMLTTAEKLMFLCAVPAFGSADTDTLCSLSELAITERFASGEVVFSQGEPGDRLYVVTEGRVTLAAEGRPLGEVGPREWFGEMALFDGKERSATATAACDTTLLTVARPDFFRLGRSAPDMLVGVIQVLCERLRTTNDRIQAGD